MVILTILIALAVSPRSSPARTFPLDAIPSRSVLTFGEYNPGRLAQFITPVSEGVRQAFDFVLNATATHGSGQPTHSPSVNYVPSQEGNPSVPLQHVFTLDTSAMPQNEQAVAKNGSLVVVASNDYRNYLTFGNRCFYHNNCNGTWIGTGIDVSENGGISVSYDQLGPSDPRAMGEMNGDPGVAIYAGTIYVTSLDFQIFRCTSGIVLWKSTNSGANFTTMTPPVNNTSCNEFTDKPSISADVSNSPYAGSLYVSWTHFGLNESDIRVASSHDGGLSWFGRTVSGPIRNGGLLQFSYSAVGPDGSIYVTYTDYSSAYTTSLNCFQNKTCPSGYGPVDIMIAKSTDGGSSWSSPARVFRVGTPLPWPFWFMADHTFRTATQPKIAVDSSSKFTRGTIYIAWEDLSAGSESDVFQCLKARSTVGIVACEPASRGSAVWLTYSSDGGLNWNAPEQINGGGTSDSFMPWVTVDNSNGNVMLAYYTSQPDPYNARIYVGVASSSNAAITFSKVILAEFYEPSVDLLTFGGFWGDYMGVSASGGTAVVAYTGDGRMVNGYHQEDPYVAILPDNPVSTRSLSIPAFAIILSGLGSVGFCCLLRSRGSALNLRRLQQFRTA